MRWNSLLGSGGEQGEVAEQWGVPLVVVESHNIEYHHFPPTHVGVKKPYLNNQITSDDDGICASEWLLPSLSD
jgi:hypothetical protein